MRKYLGYRSRTLKADRILDWIMPYLTYTLFILYQNHLQKTHPLGHR